ncbi:MAG: amidohydrolase [Acidiferrobacterales bacterium]|nr:amidohydrolase [Acidiferrobacterales bacterium]
MMKLFFRKAKVVVFFAAWFLPIVEPAIAQLPLADVHIHYNWDQKELISAEEIVQKLKKSNIAFAVATSTPTELALELKRVGGDLIIPFFSPYTHEMGRHDWHLDPNTVALAKEGLSSQRYVGIGEVHFMSGFRPHTDNAVFRQLLNLAKTYSVPVLIHIDSGNERAFLRVCRQHPDVTFLFAHAGGNLHARHIQPIVEQCKNVLVELSARDPWRYGGLTDHDHQLLPSWRKLIIQFPDRFVTGTDPVWRVTRTQSWDQSDEGWDHFEKLLTYHHRWIDGLPEAVAKKIRVDNARRLFNR